MDDVIESVVPIRKRDTLERDTAKQLVASTGLSTDKTDLSAEDLLTAILSAAKSEPKPPQKLFMGLDWQGWLGWFVKGAIVVVVFLVTWYRTVNAELQSKASHDDVKAYVHGAFAEHEKHGNHPQLTTKLLENSKALQDVRESQLMQKTTDAVQTTILKGIKADIEVIRKRRR